MDGGNADTVDGVHISLLTSAEFSDLKENGLVDSSTLYFITDDDGSTSSSSAILPRHLSANMSYLLHLD
jgi:hypothetical protein